MSIDFSLLKTRFQSHIIVCKVSFCELFSGRVSQLEIDLFC